MNVKLPDLSFETSPSLPALKSRYCQLFSVKRKYWCIDFTNCTTNSHVRVFTFAIAVCFVIKQNDWEYTGKVVALYNKISVSDQETECYLANVLLSESLCAKYNKYYSTLLVFL